MIDKYGWRDATKGEVEELAKRMDLVSVYHSIADCSLYYRRDEAEACTSYGDCVHYARRYDPWPGKQDHYQINQRNVDEWERR